MEEIPETLKEAKHKVKLELMMDQLKQETSDAMEEAKNIRAEFTSLYAKVVTEGIDKEQFKMYYSVLKVGMTDSISKLSTLYDLLKEAKLNEEFEAVGNLIGTLSEDIRLYSGKYKVALEIGKREAFKEKIEARMLSFAEYKTKMLDIMSQIMDNPDIDNVKLQVTRSKVLTNEYSNNFSKIEKDEYQESVFSKDAKDIYKKAKVICARRSSLFSKLTQIFEGTKVLDLDGYGIEALKENVEYAEEEIEALKLLKEVYVLYGQHQEYKELTSNDFKKMIGEVNEYLNKSHELQRYVENMEDYILNIYEAYRECQEFLKAYDGQNMSDLIKNASRYDDLSNALRRVAGWAFMLSMGAGFIFGDYELGKHFMMIPIPDDIFATFLRSIVLYFPGILMAASFTMRNSTEREKIKLFRKVLASQSVYEDLLKGNNSYLQDIYQRALRV